MYPPVSDIYSGEKHESGPRTVYAQHFATKKQRACCLFRSIDCIKYVHYANEVKMQREKTAFGMEDKV